jgi:hypothetical protein
LDALVKSFGSSFSCQPLTVAAYQVLVRLLKSRSNNLGLLRVREHSRIHREALYI